MRHLSIALLAGLLVIGGIWYGKRARQPVDQDVLPADPGSFRPESPADASRVMPQEPAPNQVPGAGDAFAARYGDFLAQAAARFALARPDTHRLIPSLGISELRGLREARIVCLSDPQQAGLFLKGWALDEGRPLPQRTFSIWVLAGMGLAGHETALDRLKEIGRDCRNKEIKPLAIGHLSLLTADADTHRLIMQVLPDLDLAHWDTVVLRTYDPEKVSLIRTKVAQAGNPAAWINERVERLSTPGGRQKMLQAAGTYSPDISAVLQHWEMSAAWVNRLPGLKEALRKRLDDHWVQAQAYNQSRRQKGLLADLSPVEEQYARGTGGEAIVDELHDDALLYYWRLGGELKEREWKRLQYHGFVGDQSAHLRVILPGR